MSSYQSDSAPSNQDAQRFANPGEALREARLQRGLSPAEVAEALRLSQKTLDHIETGQFDKLPGDTFGRGYIRAYARLLKLDPAEYVLAYDRQMGIQERERPVHGISQVAAYTQPTRLWVRGTSAAVLLAVVGCGVWWFSDQQRPEATQLSAEASDLMEDVQIDSLPPPVPIPGVQRVNLSLSDSSADQLQSADTAEGELAGQAVVATAADAPAQPAAAEQSAVELASVETSPAAAAAATAESTVAAAAPASGQTFQMSFSDSCWVQISTTEGKVVHSGLMQAGQTINIPQEGPLQVVIGAVEAVSSIQLAGSPVELPSNKQSGVVRLRVGERG